MEFSYYMPTRIVSGRHCVTKNLKYLAALGKKAFLMTGGNSASRNGSLEEMVEALETANIAWYHHDRVKPNPSLESVREAAEEARQFGADFVIALGGGSPMDAAKAVAVLAASPVSDQELLSLRTFPRVLPLAVVPTTSGTGSEVTPYSILTNDALQTKSFLNSEQVYPALAFLDARYTMDLPASITAATVVDALSHAVEGFLAVRATPLAQSFALESLDHIGTILPLLALSNPLNLEQRETLLYASTLAGMVIAQSGTTAVHAMGYSLTYFKGIDHGVANGLLLGRYLRYIQKWRSHDTDKIIKTLGLSSIKELEFLLSQLIGHARLSEEEIQRFSAIAIQAGNIQNTRPQPSQDDLVMMYRDCCGK